MLRPHSFFFSLLLGNLLLIAAILGFGAWWTFCEMDRQANQNSRRFQGQLLDLAKDGIESAWPDATSDIEQYCRSFANHPEFRLTVIDATGKVLGESEHPVAEMDAHNNDNHPELLEALAGKNSESMRLSLTKRIRYRYVASPLQYESKVVGAVRIAFPVTDLKENQRRLWSGIAACFTLMLLAAAVFSALLSWLWSKPLKTICQAARQISEGNLGPIPDAFGVTEMRDLHAAVDRMRRTVSAQLNTITWQRERLHSVLQYLPDAVFALDSQDRIVYYNESAEKLFQLPPYSVPSSIQYLLRHPEILDLYFSRHENGPDSTARKQTMLEIRQDGAKLIFELEFVDIADQRDEGLACLLIVQDLTNAVQTERMKADFVANTSHELRTPLTSIRMTLDNALDGIYPQNANQEVFEMLDRSVCRLEALTDDLLTLHDAEERTETTLRDKTTFLEQKEWVEEIFGRKADGKNIELQICLAEDSNTKAALEFLVDTKRLSLVLQNLLDNALKFTPSGGKIALQFLFADDNMLSIQCEDNGCGISPEEQSRVFERFYRVKRDKSDIQPGTGLGLSIVKHAVERLGGSLTLSSQLGVGSIFTVRIPIDQKT
jgi:two-component system phosphate regulon sensor histidine kinase PhoR